MLLNKNEQIEIALAALLHDIGKFKQRAYAGDEKIGLHLDSSSQESTILPSANNDVYTHRHALWTYDFFLHDFEPLIDKNDKLLSLNLDKVCRLASNHHNPSASDKLECIIANADRVSASGDRAYSAEYERGRYLKAPLRSIFDSVSLNESKDVKKSEFSYELKPLSSDGTLFPVKGLELNNDSYLNLWKKFIKGLSLVVPNIKSSEELLAKLKDLLYEYTWCIPSATNDYLNDISLYDHSVTTMSIALALACSEDVEKPIRICAFGVSGIQSFIFQSKEASFKNAAKIFRGRSFIISIFPEVFKNKLSKALGLIPYSDCLAAGGKMTLLLPNIHNIEDKIKAVVRETEEFLLKKYLGTLALVIDYSISIDCKELECGRYKVLHERVGSRLEQAKNRKFGTVINENFDPVLPFDGYKSVCSACGKHGVEELEEKPLCDVCNEQMLLGKKLTISGGSEFDEKFIVLSDYSGDVELLPSMYVSIESDPTNFGRFITSYSLSNSSDRFPIWRLNTYVPNINDFEEIAQVSVHDQRGKKFLGYLKLDVDSLGTITKDGFKDSEFSISRFATLSRTLHFFFNDYVYSLLKSSYSNTYTVLSGGDDLFLIMPWDQTLRFTDELRNKFAEFCCGNKNFHFSTGITIAKPKEPFALVNAQVNKQLDYKAKEMDGKDAIAIFDLCFKQERLSRFISEKDELRSYIKSEDYDKRPFSSGFIYRLYSYVQDVIDNRSITQRYSSISKLRYDLARNVIDKDGIDNDLKKRAVNFVLRKFDQYENIDEIIEFKTMLTIVMYELRITTEYMEG